MSRSCTPWLKAMQQYVGSRVGRVHQQMPPNRSARERDHASSRYSCRPWTQYSGWIIGKRRGCLRKAC
ncbi:hypothetical protein J3R82DRAFT_2158 [Butyriboletus roseoflavus]|nr:hypothetical protein J3R82DRAFT_2158 [Butyriboletus roseoflavus]